MATFIDDLALLQRFAVISHCCLSKKLHNPSLMSTKKGAQDECVLTYTVCNVLRISCLHETYICEGTLNSVETRGNVVFCLRRKRELHQGSTGFFLPDSQFAQHFECALQTLVSVLITLPCRLLKAKK